MHIQFSVYPFTFRLFLVYNFNSKKLVPRLGESRGSVLVLMIQKKIVMAKLVSLKA